MRWLSCLALLAACALAPAQGPAPLGPPTPVAPDGALPPGPFVSPGLAPPPPAVLPLRPIPVNEFVASFKPLPGKYEVVFVHPKTGCPVKVCFALPPGCLRCVRANAHKIVFDYKCQHDVVIRFLHNGKVWVRG